MAGGASSVLAGGASNLSNAEFSVVIGGKSNAAEGRYAVVLGGWENVASGKHSLAAGCRAMALHKGSFVWADALEEDFVTSSTNQFLVRARGGVGINTVAPRAALDVAGSVVVDGSVSSGGGIAIGRGTSKASLHVNAEAANHLVGGRAGVHSVLRSDVVSADSSWELVHRSEDRGLALYHNGVAVMSLGPNRGDLWVSTSDRRLKKDVQPVSAGVLKKMRRLPVSRFRYRDEAAARPPQTGFIAQDVRELFPEAVREVDGYLAVDYARFSVFSVAAIKELDRENSALRSSLDDLMKRVQLLEDRLRNQ